VAGTPEAAADRSWSDVGGYVHGFERAFDPDGFLLDPDDIRRLDPLFQWVLYGLRAALREAGCDSPNAHAGLVLGNLSFPSLGMAHYVEQVWLEAQPPQVRDALAPNGRKRPHAWNRFMSGLPANLAARALGLGAGAFALDAACASSLYAIKLACDRLHDRSADLMIAGAVNRADDLFIHIGFCALSALSRSGQSRPFHRDADGLVPAEGAAFVALKRLRDAERDGNRIVGVIRGIGLANDGRGQGLLVPAQEGQERAMRAAYDVAGVPPSSVSLVECHATGTPVGDATEVRSLARVFDACTDVPVGSLKSNLGHLITTAGAASLLKILGAMHAGIRPPTLNAEQPNEALQGTPLRVLREAEPWDGRRRAAISAFGFGGNNAHLIVDAWEGHAPEVRVPVSNPSTTSPRAEAPEPIAIVSIGARVADGNSTREFAQALFAGKPALAARSSIDVALDGLRFPPADLKQALGQQLLMLEAAREAARDIRLTRERTMVLVGMGCDTEVARYCARWRLPAWLTETDAASVAHGCDAFQGVLTAPGVLGTMPNMVANRLSAQLDLGGASLTVAAEETSGLIALAIARRALETGEADAALVGAVDLSHEPVHETALRELGRTQAPGDAAVALVLKRLADAQRDGDKVLALLGGEGDDAELIVGDSGGEGQFDPARLFGNAHAAKGLLAVAVATLALHHRVRPRVGAPAESWKGATADVIVAALMAPRTRIRLHGHREALVDHAPPPSLEDSVASSWPARTPGRQLTLAAHLPPVELPEIAPAMEIMPRAPWLPSVSMEIAALADTSMRSSVSAPPATMRSTGLMTAKRAHQQQLAEIHRSYLARAAQTHQQFLVTQQHAQRLLLAAYSNVRSDAPPRPVVPRPVAPMTNLPEGERMRAAPATTAPATARLPGPKFNRAQLEHLASGNISEIFGAQFAPQDQYARQTRMPTPPLLLADRVTGIDAEPASMKLGKMWTETDVRADAWYLTDEGRVPAGVMIECGQADLLLISYLGIDLLNRGERVYRLLGCDLTYSGGMPQAGETLAYDIHVDGHAQQGDVRLFFFRYDCRVNGQLRLQMRNGQAGFFTDAELKDSGGVLWDPASEPYQGTGPLDPPAVVCSKRRFTREEVRAFAEARPVDCFGPGWEWTRTHVRTPRISSGQMLFLDEVSEFDPKGGPWGRGYLRAETPIAPTDWFFEGHFKNDPCMPGTLMFDGCLQALSFYLTAMGYTLRRDAWRFEIVPEETYKLRCRGQVIPTSRRLTYEVFVHEVSADPIPTVYADLLCTVDGTKAFHARRVGLRLVPDWPLPLWKTLGPHAEQTTGEWVGQCNLGGLVGYKESKPCAVVEGFTYDYHSLLACAWGRPTQMFGPMYQRFEGGRRVARLPGPPYHFMSRILSVEGPQGGMQKHSRCVAEYDLPKDVWYFEQNGYDTMPLCVFMEAALQPCGWLSSYVGSTLADSDLLLRNLDGHGALTREIRRGAGILRTHAELTNVARGADTMTTSASSTVPRCSVCSRKRPSTTRWACRRRTPSARSSRLRLTRN
jgi:3-oxoacyl-(acyl-carrier-protein) synthase/3-hydroxymyristoyl/3-hydroxydecanoyl-(acyl carrier protein) dehydratase